MTPTLSDGPSARSTCTRERPALHGSVLVTVTPTTPGSVASRSTSSVTIARALHGRTGCDRVGARLHVALDEEPCRQVLARREPRLGQRHPDVLAALEQCRG